MTAHKHLKQLIRARMQKTGERYTSARRHVLRQSSPPTDPAARWHFPGNVPAATALRVLLAQAGVRAPHTGEPFSEALVFGLAGGIGAGVFSFVYEKENFASFFVAGRHSWQDDLVYLNQACTRLGITPTVRESAGPKTAQKQLRESLAEGACIAWVDLTLLPHRGMPASMSGSGYHVVSVYRVDESASTALIGDLADKPISLPLADLARSRERIKKQKQRLFFIPASPQPVDLAATVHTGLRACHQGLVGAGGKRTPVNFTLAAFRQWGERLHGSKDKESWERIFTPGPRLWQGLTSIYQYVEHYGTGGGLSRPLFADFLAEASEALGKPALRALGERYAELGRAWSELAEAALPDEVPILREAREVSARKAEATVSGEPSATEEVRELWKRLGELRAQACASFPLTAGECADLRARLQERILALYEGEMAAHAALGAVLDA